MMINFLKNSKLINNISVFKQSIRSVSYVERARILQQLKDNHHACKSKLQEGRFLVYNGSKPLIKTNFNIQDDEDEDSGPLWLTFPAIKDAIPDPINSCVLLDVTEEGIPQFGIQIKTAPDSVKENIESTSGGQYFDLRIALLFTRRKEAHLISRANSLLRWNSINVFCGKCGSKTNKTIVGNSRTCPSCENVCYPSASPVGIVLITDPQNEYSLLVRQPRSVPGMYSCVAGFSDVGECFEQTVKREVAEEVGLEVTEVHYIASQHWPFPSSLMIGCFAVAEKMEPQIDTNELVDAKWYMRDEISEALQRIKTDSFRRIIGGKSGKLIVPPPGAIAHHLIYHWLHRTPLADIQRHIYKT